MLRKLQNNLSSLLPLPLEVYRQLVVQSPRCIRILQAMWLLSSQHPSWPLTLSQLRFFLNESWDEMMNTMSLLHTATYAAKTPFSAIPAAVVTMLAISWEPPTMGPGPLFCDLTCGCLRLVESNASCTLIFERQPSEDRLYWGELVRCSPQSSPELLRSLQEFHPRWDSFSTLTRHCVHDSGQFPTCKCDWRFTFESFGESHLDPVNFHHDLQWLKTHMCPPTELIARWQHHLEQSLLLPRFSPVKASLDSI
ncbi:hypothetical protein B0H16DRAFT_463032 [Mycena metata]|uniref:Uncharacterized protein n=1 Tax=Mycena metata TaxID=1033252 RepID=A0AAD7HAN3_9AGAR|nr:hypothetical protein B0H16DRAFT_463032 [Mycena metata]